MQRFNVFLMLLQGNMEKCQTDPHEGLNLWPSQPLGSARLMRGESLNYIGCWDDNTITVVCHLILLGLKSCQNEHILVLTSRKGHKNKNGKTLPIINFDVFGQNNNYYDSNCSGKILSRSPNFAKVLTVIAVALLAKQSCKCIADETIGSLGNSTAGRLGITEWPKNVA